MNFGDIKYIALRLGEHVAITSVKVLDDVQPHQRLVRVVTTSVIIPPGGRCGCSCYLNEKDHVHCVFYLGVNELHPSAEKAIEAAMVIHEKIAKEFENKVKANLTRIETFKKASIKKVKVRTHPLD